MFANRISSSTSCSIWLPETSGHRPAVRSGRLKPRRPAPLGTSSVTVFKVATLPGGVARRLGGCCCDLIPLLFGKAGTRSLYRQRCHRLLVRSSGIDSGTSIVGLLFRSDLLLRSGVHQDLCGSVRVAKKGQATKNDRKTSGCCPRPQVLWLECQKILVALS